MSDVEVKYLGEMQRMALNDGDVMVVSFPGPIGQVEADDIREYLANFLDKKVQVIVFGDGAKIGVLGKEQPAP